MTIFELYFCYNYLNKHVCLKVIYFLADYLSLHAEESRYRTQSHIQ